VLETLDEMHGRGLRLIRSLPFAHPCGALSISRPPDSLDSRRERFRDYVRLRLIGNASSADFD